MCPSGFGWRGYGGEIFFFLIVLRVVVNCVSYQAGSDIGGSLKIPASYCGVYSFNPSFGRISRLGIGGQYYALVIQLY
jgi:hypothetical protein